MKPATLECNHCGDVAIASSDGLFTDGDGERCLTCGMPGHVIVDGDDEEPDLNPVHWNDTQEAGVYCRRPECAECVELRIDDREAARNLAGLASPT